MCGCCRARRDVSCTCPCHVSRKKADTAIAGQWKPGDVAMVSDPAHGNLTMMFFDDRTECWHGVTPEGSMRCLDADQADDARPLLVIDPEAFGDVNRLLGAMVKHGWTGLNDEATTDMQAALRSLLPTPKPPEPLGLGAVIGDADNAEWLRVGANLLRPWAPVGKVGDPGNWAGYAAINAIETLSDGVA